MTEICFDSMKTEKNNPHGRKKPMWKEKIEREIEHMRRESSTEFPRTINVKGRACETLKRKYKVKKDNIIISKEIV